MTIHLILMILHLFGAGLLIGICVLAVLAVIKPPITKVGMDRLSFVARLGMGASGAQFITGAIMMATEWDELGHNPLVWTKIILWVIEGTLASLVISRQAKQAGVALANGQTPTRGLPNSLLIQAFLVLLIAALGIIVVETGK